ncbi:MAG: TolC family outer membrane protein [Alphaproteobacteria bacterium]
MLGYSKRFVASAAMGLVLAGLLPSASASAETLRAALAAAYANNGALNAQRAALRAIDEGVPQALSGYRPTIIGLADAGFAFSTSAGATTPAGVSITVEQPLFLGYRTANSVKIAETAVLAGRESLRMVEQQTLLAAAQAFMGLVRAQAIINLRRQNVEFQREQVRAADDRLNVGEGTRTDVAQTKARLGAGQSELNAASAALNTAIAVYELVIGHRPKSLGRANGIDRNLPRSLEASMAAAAVANPAVLGSRYNVDIASFNVSVLEGTLLPSVSVAASASHRVDAMGPGTHTSSASLVGRVSVPIYGAGLPSSKVRQAKQTLGQRRIEYDVALAQSRQLVISAWGQLDAARAQIRAANAQVTAERLVLSGVTEERKVGQRTTLDVLNAQQALLNARVGHVSAQHDRVVASYALMSSVGSLDARSLGLPVLHYEPREHYEQVRDAWHGLRTPDGR